jgi:predicted aspartyl protease
MNQSLPSIALSLGLWLLPLVLKTSAQPECFLEAPNRQQIDLSRLCGGESGDNSPSRMFQLPIRRRVSGIPTVIVTFNDRHRYEMLFDTGASGILLTEAMAEEIGVKKEREVIAKTAGGMVTAHVGRVSSVKAGNLTLQNTSVGISSHLEGMGLLGQTFFSRYDVTIKKNVIELRTR